MNWSAFLGALVGAAISAPLWARPIYKRLELLERIAHKHRCGCPTVQREPEPAPATASPTLFRT